MAFSRAVELGKFRYSLKVVVGTVDLCGDATEASKGSCVIVCCGCVEEAAVTRVCVRCLR